MDANGVPSTAQPQLLRTQSYQFLCLLAKKIKELNITGQYLGSFKQLTYHPVAGDLTVRDDQTFTIRNFVYDGEGNVTYYINSSPRGGGK